MTDKIADLNESFSDILLAYSYLLPYTLHELNAMYYKDFFKLKKQVDQVVKWKNK